MYTAAMPGCAWLIASDWAAERRAGMLLAPRAVMALKYLSHSQHACCLLVCAEIYIPLVEISSPSKMAWVSGGGAIAIANFGSRP